MEMRIPYGDETTPFYPINGPCPTYTTSWFLPYCSPRLLLIGVMSLVIDRLGYYGQYWGYSYDSSSKSLIFCPFSSCPLLVSWLLVYLPLTETIKSEVALRAPELSLVLDLGSETRLNWCCQDFRSTPCLPFSYMRVLAAHPQSLLGIMFPVHDFMKSCTHGTSLFPYCVSDSAYMLAKMVLESLPGF